MSNKKNERRRVTVSLDPLQFAELESLMKEDGQTNYTFYYVYLVKQERNRRMEITTKRPVGRPKGTSNTLEDTNLYPAPYKGGGAYTKDDWIGYYEFRKEEVPPLPDPLTPAEIAKFS